MRFHLGSPPDEFVPDSSWRPIREPGPFVMQLFAAPLCLGMAVLAFYCWMHVWLPLFELRNAALLLSLAAIIVVHELLHAVATPRFGCTPSTVIGAWPARLLFYATYCGPLTRDRYLVVFAMPFLLLTVLPLVAAAGGLLPPALVPAAAWCSVWNALFSGGDCLGFALVLVQIPRAANVQNQGWRTYWKPINANTA